MIIDQIFTEKMTRQEKMFEIIEEWKMSDLMRADFLKKKHLSRTKFGYWLGKYNKLNGKNVILKKMVEPEFKEMAVIDVEEKKQQKIIELTLTSGIQITIYG